MTDEQKAYVKHVEDMWRGFDGTDCKPYTTYAEGSLLWVMCNAATLICDTLDKDILTLRELRDDARARAVSVDLGHISALLQSLVCVQETILEDTYDLDVLVADILKDAAVAVES